MKEKENIEKNGKQFEREVKSKYERVNTNKNVKRKIK